MLPRYENGRIPTSALVRLDTGNGRHLATATSAVRWYLLRRNVLARTGVTLYITPGMNAYRDWEEQGVGRRNACAAGNCNAAASQGYSSHGGTWRYNGRWVDAMAFDIGNYWAIPWAVFVEECAAVGLRTGLITRAIAGIDEPWHVIDLDPHGAAPDGLKLTKGADGVWRLEEFDIMASKQEIKDAFVEVLRGVKEGPGGRNHWDTLKFIAAMVAAAQPDKVWSHPIQAQTEEGHPVTKDGRPVMFAARGYLASTNARVGGAIAEIDEVAVAAALAPILLEHVQSLSDADVARLAQAAADESDRRARERLGS